ncbi:hypothetical protein ACOMHN_058548 [Nucella lapillus]
MDATIILPIPFGVFFGVANHQGFCFVCKKALHSIPMKTEHLNGRKHKNKMMDMFGALEEGESGGEEEQMMRCSTCEVILFGQSSVHEHLNSYSHRARMTERDSQTGPQAVPDTAPNAMTNTVPNTVPQTAAVTGVSQVSAAEAGSGFPQAAGYQGSSCPGQPHHPESSVASLPPHQEQPGAPSTACQLEEQLDSLTLEDGGSVGDNTPVKTPRERQLDSLPTGERQLPSGQARNLETWTREAEVNDLSGGSRSAGCGTTGLNVPPSVSGQEGKATDTVRSELSEDGLSYSRTCSVCGVPFTGGKSAAEHFSSKNHKEKADLLRRLENKEFTQDPETGALKMKIDGIDWYVCDVCLCRMNSKNPYKEHAQSRQHMINCESKRLLERAKSGGGAQRRLDGSVLPSDSLMGNLAGNSSKEQLIALFPIGAARQGVSGSIPTQPQSRQAATNLIPQDAEAPTEMAAFERSQSASGPNSRKSMAQRVQPDGDSKQNDGDDLTTLPSAGAAARYQEAVPSLEDNNLVVESQYAESTVSGVSSISNNESLGYAESLLLLKNTTPERSTLSHTEPAMRGQGVSERNIVEEDPSQIYGPLNGFPHGCHLCSRGMNTEKDLEIHKESFYHKTKSATVLAEDRSKEPLVTREDERTIYAEIYPSSKTIPRTYQVQLLCKIMASDSAVVFLPTGTGNTLVAMMTIRRMLILNPTRPVLFLTNEALLVKQYGASIQKELEESIFRRPHLMEDGRMEDRRLKVARLCGGLSVNDATPLWKYDIIVITAVYCQNLLQRRVLRWANFSLVVIAEADLTCSKGHPFKALVEQHHLPLTPHPPKILGLTSSQAGASTQEKTLGKLKALFNYLGEASMVAMDEKSNVTAEKNARDQLCDYSSNARLLTESVPRTEKEQEFNTKLGGYFAETYRQLLELSNLKTICVGENFGKIGQDDEIDKWRQLAQLDGIQSRQLDRSDVCEQFEAVHRHVRDVGQALLNSLDGITFALDDLNHVFDASSNPDIPKLTGLGPAVDDITQYVESLRGSLTFPSAVEDLEESSTLRDMSIYRKLQETLVKTEYVDWRDPTSKALVLVREKETAVKVYHLLIRSKFVRENGIGTEILAEPGSGGESGGVRKQSSSRDKTIFVATFSAEKGPDVPQCGLVVCLNAPSRVKAVSQMRGRTRRKDSVFVALRSGGWGGEREREERGGLLEIREVNMTWAVNHLLRK